MGKGVRKRQQRAKAQEANTKRQPAACVLPNFLYLGPVSATANSTFLHSHGITDILSIGRSPARRFDNHNVPTTATASRRPNLSRITYHRLALEDLENADIKP